MPNTPDLVEELAKAMFLAEGFISLDWDELVAHCQSRNAVPGYVMIARNHLLPIVQAAVTAETERCCTAVRDCMVDQEWPPEDGDRQISEVLAAIRASRGDEA